MNKLLRKILLPIVFALFALAVCFVGSYSIIANKSRAASAAASDYSVVIKSDKAQVGAGEEFTITMTIKSTASGEWRSLGVIIGITDIESITNATEKEAAIMTNAQYLEFVPGTAHCNLIDDYDYDPIQMEYISSGKKSSQIGMSVQFADKSDDDWNAISMSTDLVISFTLKVKDNADSMPPLKFGPMTGGKNQFTISNASGVLEDIKFKDLSITPLDFKLGKISSNAKLSRVEAGGGTTLAEVASGTVSNTLSYNTVTTNNSSFKIKLTPTDATTTFKYSIGSASDPSNGTAVGNTGTITTALDNSGTTVVKVYTTAEDGTSHETYTLTIVNKYVSLSALGLTVSRPSGATALGSDFNTLNPDFKQDTDTEQSNGNYTVKIPSDHTQVQLTPTNAANYGIANSIAVQATGANASSTSVNSGSALSLTDVTNGATVKLTLTGVDGATKVYTITFDVKNVDTSIASITMTSGGNVVNGAETGTGWTFTLDEDAQYKGTFNVTLGAPSTSTLTIGSDAYSATREYTAGTTDTTLTFKVTAEAGNTKDYTVVLKRLIKAGELKDLKFNAGSDAPVAVDNTNSTLNSTTTGGKPYNTYTIKLSYDPALYAGQDFYITGTPTSGATPSTSGNLTGNGANAWKSTARLAYSNGNATTYSITVSSPTGVTVYNFEVALKENKNDITGIVFKQGGKTNVVNFDNGAYFNPATTTYTINVPFKDYATLDLEVTTDGKYCQVKDGEATLTNTAGTQTHTRTSIALTPGTPTVLRIAATSDKGTGTEGTPYTVTITRANADTNAALSRLELWMDGSPVSFAEGSFNSTTDTYTYTVPSPAAGTTTASMELYAVAESATSTITGSPTLGAYNSVDTKFRFTYTYPTSNKTDTYQIFVTPESGNTDRKTYTVQIKREIAKGDLTDVRMSYDNSYFPSIFTGFEDTNTTTKTYTAKVALSDLPNGIGSDIYFEADATADAKITPTGLTYNASSGKYVGKITSFGDKNEYKLAAGTSSGTTTYIIKIEVYEDIDAITDIKVMNGTTELSSDLFSFSEWQDNYPIEVDFTVSSVVIRVKPEGNFEIIKADGATVGAKKADGYYEINSGSLSTTAKTIKIYGVANEGRGKTDGTMKGMEYTFVLTKAKADADATLSSLEVKIDGTAYDLLDNKGGDPINFDPDTNEYYVDFEKWGSATSATVSITAEAANPNSTVSGLPTGSGNFKYKVNEEHSETYTITVKAQSGVTNSYKVHVRRVVLVGDFDELEIKLPKESSFTSVRDDYTNYDDAEKVYTLDLKSTDYAIGSSLTIKAKPNSASTVTTNPKLTASSNNYTIKLEQGSHEYEFTATSSSGSTTYKFVINLFEEKNEIENITFKPDKGSIGSDLFSFKKNTNSYEFKVPNTMSQLTMTVKTDGDYTTVVDGDGNTLEKKTNVARTHEMIIDLQPGETTTIGVRAVSDSGVEGETYWIEIFCEQGVIEGNIAQIMLDDNNGLLFNVDTSTQAFDVYKDMRTAFTRGRIALEVLKPAGGVSYTMGRIENGVKTEEIDGNSRFMLDLNIGTNVFCVYFDLGYELKPVIFIIERVEPSLNSLSAVEIKELESDFNVKDDTYSYSVASNIQSLTLMVGVDTSLYRYEVEGADSLSYGMNHVTIKLYDIGRAGSNDPVKTITLNVFRESNRLFWIVMSCILAVLAVALVIIVLLVRRNNRNNGGGNSEDPVVITQPAGGGNGGNQPIVIRQPGDSYIDPYDGSVY